MIFLKVGYCKDSFSNSRETAYNTHNYGYKFCGEYYGDELLEGIIHSRYRKLNLNLIEEMRDDKFKVREWFKYNKEIVDLFKYLQDPLSDYIGKLDKEEFIERFRSFLIYLSNPLVIYYHTIEELIGELREEHDNNYPELLWEEELYKERYLNSLIDIYNERVKYWENYNFQDNIEFMELLNDGIEFTIENPWKNRAELYYKTSRTEKSKEEFDKIIDAKINKTLGLLDIYDKVVEDDKKAMLIEKFSNDQTNYKSDYLSVNKHAGSNPIPVFNNLVLISEKRAFDKQQIDYKDRFSVFNTLVHNEIIDSISGTKVSEFLQEFSVLPGFYDKMKFLCESDLDASEIYIVLDQIPLTYKTYYDSLGPARLKANGYNITKIQKEFSILKIDKGSFIDAIMGSFKVGEKYSKSSIKNILTGVYDSLGIKNRKPKASDLEEYFEIKSCLILNKDTGKRDNGFKILAKKN